MEHARHRRSHQPRKLAVENLEDRFLMAFDPSIAEQELMQLTNRFRADPRNEFSRLVTSVSPRATVDSKITEAVNFFNTDLALTQNELSLLNPLPPVAWDETAYRVSQEYTPLMIQFQSQLHNLNGPLQQRLLSYPFDISAGSTFRENLNISAFSPIHNHAAYVIDWGSGSGGMLSPRGHRNGLMDPDVKVAGIAWTPATFVPGKIGPFVNAQDLVGLGVTKPMFTGAVFNDQNLNTWYDAQEGIGGVKLTFVGPTGQFEFTTMNAGGYNAQVPPGTYTVTATSPALRFPIVKPNVALGTTNVWLNFIYDPNAIPPDALESNDSAGSSTRLNGKEQTISGGTLHSPSDVDYFEFQSTTVGTLNLTLSFQNAVGNIDLVLQDTLGTVIAQSKGLGNLESISYPVTFGQRYFIVVQSAARNTGGPYELHITPPPAQAPQGREDSQTTDKTSEVLLDVLSNDSDRDGVISQAQIVLDQVNSGSPNGALAIVSNAGRMQIRYTPSGSFAGIDTFSYRIRDIQGLSSEPVKVSVMVLDLAAPHPFQNPLMAMDVNGDGLVTSIDALLVINQINTRRGSQLPVALAEARTIFGYVDVNDNGTLEPLDVLLVINRLNSSNGQAEAEPSDTDTLPINLMAGYPNADDTHYKTRHRKSR